MRIREYANTRIREDAPDFVALLADIDRVSFVDPNHNGAIVEIIGKRLGAKGRPRGPLRPVGEWDR